MGVASNSLETLKASHRIAGGRARVLRGAPGLRYSPMACTLKGCDTNRGNISIGEDPSRVNHREILLHPYRVRTSICGYRPGAPRKKRALPPATLFDPAQRGLKQNRYARQRN